MSSFTCRCGSVFKDGEEPQGASGLLKPLTSQVNLECYQANEISTFISSNEDERQIWIKEKFGPEYPKDHDLKEIIEDFLYKSHREDGCTATFQCPNCGRLATLYEASTDWKFYDPENHA